MTTATATAHQKIRDNFSRMGTPLASLDLFFSNGQWEALSQYGFVLCDGFCCQAEAEAYVLSFYSARMNLIEQ